MNSDHDKHRINEAMDRYNIGNATEDTILSMEEEVATQGTAEWWDFLNHLMEASKPSDLMPLFEKDEAAELYPEIMKLFEALVDRANESGPDPYRLAEIVGWQL